MLHPMDGGVAEDGGLDPQRRSAAPVSTRALAHARFIFLGGSQRSRSPDTSPRPHRFRIGPEPRSVWLPWRMTTVSSRCAFAPHRFSRPADHRGRRHPCRGRRRSRPADTFASRSASNRGRSSSDSPSEGHSHSVPQAGLEPAQRSQRIRLGERASLHRLARSGARCIRNPGSTPPRAASSANIARGSSIEASSKRPVHHGAG